MVTTTTGNAIDWARVRDDFPILASENERGQRLAFLDSAASSQKPEQVIAAVDRYYRETNANIHRGVYDLSERATAQYEAARHMVADFVNAHRRARSSSFGTRPRRSTSSRRRGAAATSRPAI